MRASNQGSNHAAARRPKGAAIADARAMIDARKDEWIRLLRDLIKLPSCFEAEHDVVRYVYEYISAAGLAPVLVPMDTGQLRHVVEREQGITHMFERIYGEDGVESVLHFELLAGCAHQIEGDALAPAKVQHPGLDVGKQPKFWPHRFQRRHPVAFPCERWIMCRYQPRPPKSRDAGTSAKSESVSDATARSAAFAKRSNICSFENIHEANRTRSASDNSCATDELLFRRSADRVQEDRAA
jgi:hypothetical protein